MLNKLLNIFRIPDLRNKLFFTVALLCVYRIGFYIPIPGIDAAKVREELNGPGGGGLLGDISNYLSLVSGGDLTQGTIFGLGIMPYISASIILQLLGTVVPTLEKLKKEGEPGIRKINEWTRYLCVAVSIFQSLFYVTHFNTDAGRSHVFAYVLNNHFALFQFLIVVSFTCGSVFLMWLGEQIDAYGIGNGVSLIITAGIIARMPLAIEDLTKYTSFGNDPNKPINIGIIIFLIACFIFVVAASILLTQAQRRISVQQAKHMRGRRVYGGAKQYLPLRVNHAGVMPIIFASTLAVFPLWGFRALEGWARVHYPGWFHQLSLTLANAFNYSYLYYLMYLGLIFFFSYFWNTVQFQPKEMANQLRDHGSFIPGLRPGKRTADYLENVMARITYVGAAFLCVIAIIPTVIANSLLKGLNPNTAFQITQFLGGTGLLIVISVMLDLVNRIEANLVMRNYGGFMDDSGGGTNRINRPKTRQDRGPKSPSSYDAPKELPA